MKTTNDLKSIVINNFIRNPRLYEMTTLGDIKSGIALPNSGRVKPIAVKAAKEAGLDMNAHKRACDEFKEWLASAFIEQDILKAQAKLDSLLKMAEAMKAPLTVVLEAA